MHTVLGIIVDKKIVVLFLAVVAKKVSGAFTGVTTRGAQLPGAC